MTAIAVIYKLILYLAGLGSDQMAMFSIFGYLLIILVGSFFAVRNFKLRNQGSTFLDDVKAGMKATTLFALLFSAYIYVHYSYVDTHYFPQLRQERIELAEKEAAKNPEYDPKGIEEMKKFGETWSRPQPHSTITLFALTITGAVYSLLIAVMMRRLPGFK